MFASPYDVLVLLGLLQIKHMFADYFLQTRIMLEGRDAYWHLGRGLHAGVHAVGSVLVLLAMATTPVVLAILVIGEYILHFNIDFWKARHSRICGHTPADAGFWRAAGFDQALHQLTYVAMAAIWVAL